MFENLVESNSHKDDLARKGSFFFGTIMIYAVLGLILFTYIIIRGKAELDANDDLDLTALVAPVPVPPQQAQPEQKEAPKPAEKQTAQPEVAQRTEFIANVDAPIVPKTVSAVASKVPPVPPGQAVVLGSRNVDPVNSGGPIGVPGGSGTVGGGGGGGGNIVKDIGDPPPPAPTPKPVPKAPISGGVLNGKATSLPKPAYPAMARSAHASGTVVVQVTIDENGNVISARAVSGHPLLQAAAVSAARGAKFSPTKLSGQPVKVTGTITYNFQAQ